MVRADQHPECRDWDLEIIEARAICVQHAHRRSFVSNPRKSSRFSQYRVSFLNVPFLCPDELARLRVVQLRLADGFRRWGVQLVRYGHVP